MSVAEGARTLVAQLRDPIRSNQALLALLYTGKESVPALAEFLRSSKHSTVAEPRLLAVEGLSILRGPEALEVLIEVATRPLAQIADPVVRLAEEVVVSRAALALADFSEPRAPETLLQLLEGKPLIGVAEAFEKLKDTRAIPGLVSWLEEDFVAEAAARAIRACGRDAVPALLDSLGEKHMRYGSETGMSQRRRARILEILGELAQRGETGFNEDLLEEPGEAVRLNAARALLSRGNFLQRRRAFRVAMQLLDSSDNRLRTDCDALLTAHFDLGSDLLEEEIRHRRITGESQEAFWPRETTLSILLRIYRKGENPAK